MDTKRAAWIALGLCSGLAATACSEDEVDAQTAQAAMNELVSSVDTTVAGYQSGGAGAGTVNLKCNAGGTADVSGHVNVAMNPVSVDVKVAIDYNACQTKNGTTLDGNLDFTQSVVAGKVPVRVETRYQGDVKLTGKVEADCAVNVSVLVDEAGKTVQVTGDVCGNNAADLDLTIAPRWKG
jgi:hypothetical protein